MNAANKLQKPPVLLSPAPKFHLSSLNKPLATKFGQIFEEFATFLVQLGCDSSPRREPKFSHAI